MTLVLPPRVEREILKEKWVDQRAQLRALVFKVFDFDDAVCKEWGPPLRALDPRLRLGKAKPKAHAPALGVIPGLYHWIVLAETAPPSVHPVTNRDGGFAYPDSGLLVKLKANDLQDPRVWAEMIDSRAKAERDAEAAKDAETQRLTNEIIDRYRTGNNASVSMAGSWAASNAGKRGRKR